MIHARSCLVPWCFASAVVAVCAVGTATAQTTTINQTSCISGGGSCTTGGFLQDLSVDCSAAGPAGRLSTALASIADRNGPNRITLAGICNNENPTVVGFNRLTIQGGATLSRGLSIVNSRSITLKSLLFNLATAPGANLSLNGSNVVLDGVTVQSAQFNYGINVGPSSQLGFTGAPSFVTGNGLSGINVGAGSLVNVANVTISNNGLQGAGTFERSGIAAHNGASVNLANQITVNGVRVDAPVDISGHPHPGIIVQGGTLTTDAEGGSALIHIHDNNDVGLELDGGIATMNGHLKFDGNNPNPGEGFSSAQVVAAGGATIAIGEGAQVLGGMVGLFNSFLVIGDGGPMTITGGVILIGGSSALLADANTIDSISCDAASWLSSFFGMSSSTVGLGTNTCPSDAPRGQKGDPGVPGPKGDKGDKGDQGAPGIAGTGASPISGSILTMQAGTPIPPGYKFLGSSDLTLTLPTGESRRLPVSIVGFDLVPVLPTKVRLVSPVSDVITTTPAFIWTAVPDATLYLLNVIQPGRATFERWYSATEVGCPDGYGPCTATQSIVAPGFAPGRASWKVIAYDQAGYGPWSDVQDLSIDVADPAAVAPQPVGPSGAIATANPTYIWTAVPSATLYRLSIRINGGAASLWWYSPLDAGCQTTAQCSATPPANLQNGTTEWQVQSWTASGHSDWSASLVLNVGAAAPSRPTLVSPSGTTSASPQFVWNASPTATYYYIHVNDPTGLRIDRWLKPEQVGCASGATCTLDGGVTLATGAGTWEVIAWNPGGYSGWTPTMAFTVP